MPNISQTAIKSLVVGRMYEIQWSLGHVLGLYTQILAYTTLLLRYTWPWHILVLALAAPGAHWAITLSVPYLCFKICLSEALVAPSCVLHMYHILAMFGYNEAIHMATSQIDLLYTQRSNFSYPIWILCDMVLWCKTTYQCHMYGNLDYWARQRGCFQLLCLYPSNDETDISWPHGPFCSRRCRFSERYCFYGGTYYGQYILHCSVHPRGTFLMPQRLCPLLD